MVNDTMVTIQGWIGNVPMLRDVNGASVLNFRVGSTPRHLNRTTGEWVDAETQWYGVSAWRKLATHAARSLKQGDPVVIHGRLNHRTYVNKNGAETIAVEIDALTIGHDLTRGVGMFVKAPPTGEVGRATEAAGPFDRVPEDPFATAEPTDEAAADPGHVARAGAA